MREQRILLHVFLIVSFMSGASHLDAGMPDPWRYIGAYPTGADLRAVWVASEDDVFVGGSGGTILRWDGTEWESMETPTHKTIYDIHGVSVTDVWAVGGDPNATDVTDRCVILHYNGTSWSEVTSPLYTGWSYTLENVHALASNDVWAIPAAGILVAHWNGASWQLSVPLLEAEGSFNDLTGAAPDHIFVVGSHGQILHRTGGAWVMERKTESGGLSTDVIKSVWALDASTVWAGSNATFNSYDLLERETNGTWTEVSLAQPCGLDTIWGSSSSKIYFVQSNAICLFNGTSIEQTWDFSAGVPSTSGWISAHGAGDTIFAVGPAKVHEVAVGAGSQGTTALVMKMGGAPASRQLTGTTPYGATEILAWGGAEIMAIGDSEGIQFQSRPPGGSESSDVTAMLAPAADDVYMSWSGGLHHYDGAAWTEVVNQYGGSLHGVLGFWRSPSGTVFCINGYQLLSISADLRWHEVHQDYSLPFSAISGSSDSDILLGTSDGRIFHWDGASLDQEPGTVTGGVDFLAGVGNDFYAVGDDGSALRRDPVSHTWSQLAGVEERAGESFTGLAPGSDGVYATQQMAGLLEARLWRFAGATATMISAGIGGNPGLLVRSNDGYLRASQPKEWAAGVTDRPLPEGFTMKRLSDVPGEWVAMGDTGVSLLAEGPGNPPMVMANLTAGTVPLSEMLETLFGPDWEGIPYTQLKQEVAIMTGGWTGDYSGLPSDGTGDWLTTDLPPDLEDPNDPLNNTDLAIRVALALQDLTAEDYANLVHPSGGGEPAEISTDDFYIAAQVMYRREGDDWIESCVVAPGEEEPDGCGDPGVGWVPVDTERNQYVDAANNFITEFTTSESQGEFSFWTVGTSLIFRDDFEDGDTSKWD